MPKPEPPAEIAWLWTKATHGTIEAARNPATPISIPQHLLDMLDRHGEAHSEWWRNQPTLEDADLQRLEKARERIWDETYAVRQAILDTPSSSPRAMLIEMAVGFDADTLAELPAKIEEAGDFGAEFAAAILPDLEALAGERLTRISHSGRGGRQFGMQSGRG